MDRKDRMDRAYDLSALKDLCRGRRLFVWGAADQGLAWARFLARDFDRPAEALVDRSPELIGQRRGGLPVIGPRDFFGGPGGFLFIATVRHNQAISQDCQAAGLAPGRDFLTLDQLRPFIYNIEVSGDCNLQCLFCGRRPGSEPPPAGQMSLELYRRIVDKMLSEVPLTRSVNLSVTSEPLLNPELPEMVAHGNRRGLDAVIATNLCLEQDFRELIQAGPAHLRVTLSGVGPTYESAHRGGRWPLLRANLDKLRDYRARYRPQMEVELHYLLCRHNLGRPRAEARRLAAELGFTHREIWAMPAPMEDLVDLASGRPPANPFFGPAHDLLILPLAEGLAEARRRRHQPCLAQGQVNINWDGRLLPCACGFSSNYLSRAEYLSTPFRDLGGPGPLCPACREHGLQTLFSVYGEWERLRPYLDRLEDQETRA